MSFLNKFAQKIDYRKYGLIVGFIVPIITFLLVWQFKLTDYSFKDVIRVVGNSSSKKSLIIFPIIPNLILFYFSNFRLKINLFTMGLVATTIFYAFVIAVIILL